MTPDPEQNQPLPIVPVESEEDLKKKLRQLDFEAGAQTQHLRLPYGLPKNPKTNK